MALFAVPLDFSPGSARQRSLFDAHSPSRLVILQCHSAGPLARDHQFHDLRRAIANFEAHTITHALLVRQVQRPAIMAVRQQALMRDINGSLGAELFANGRFRCVRCAIIL